jgi:hypothetical protein
VTKRKTKTAVPIPDSPWRSRIVGSGAEEPEQLLANPSNWRTHPGPQRDAIRGSLSEVGWVQQVIVNQTTGHVIDGHLRIEEAISAGVPSIPVLYVELTEDEERLVLATLDPLGEMAGQSDDRLRDLLADVSVDSDALMGMLAKMLPDTVDPDDLDAINVPRYEPTGERPKPSALYDESKTERLRFEIIDADLDAETTAYLLAAAGRHTVFDYGLGAEFYAHASPEVQRLMEASALVIIDYKDAIRDGYIRFVQAVEALRAQDLER